MRKTTIKNRAEPEWTPVIETKLQIMLGSMLAHISRVDVEFDRDAKSRQQYVTYSCKLALTEASGEKYLVCSDQPGADIAIEGAIARARRAMTRRSRARAPGWRQASAH